MSTDSEVSEVALRAEHTASRAAAACFPQVEDYIRWRLDGGNPKQLKLVAVKTRTIKTRIAVAFQRCDADEQ